MREQFWGIKWTARIAAALLVGVSSAGEVSAPPDNEIDYPRWEREALDAISKHSMERTDEAKEKLALYVFKLSLPYNKEVGGRPVFEAARSALVAHPDHAEYFRSELLDLRDRHRQNRVHDYNFERRKIFDILSQLQSPEVVRLLIELLEDHEDFREGGSSRWSDIVGNDILAAGRLTVLVADLPLERDRYGNLNLDIPALQKWGAGVLDGSRTFRFAGDSRTFTIDGPVQETRRESKRLAPTPPETNGQTSSGKPVGTLSLVIAIGLAIAGAVTVILRRRAREAGC